MSRLRIALVSSEITPFAKTGGLADVAAGLARHLDAEGHDVRLFLPYYSRVRTGDDGPFDPVEDVRDVAIQGAGRFPRFSLRKGRLPSSDASVYAVECPELYDRDDVYTSLYTDADDEHLRFATLCRAVLESCQRWQWAPDVIHCNDWHTGLLPLYVQTLYAWDRLFQSTRTVMTIHNIGYQGVFGSGVIGDLGLDDCRRYLHQDDLQGGTVNFLKTGVLHADALTTVSETYADEIQTEEFGMGLEGLLRDRRHALTGIVNGVDYGDWDPATDPLIPANYTADDLSGKATCKRQLLEGFDLKYSPEVPVLGVVSRLTGQKGFELLPDVLPVILQRDVQVVVLGSGEDKYEQYFQWLRDTWPQKVAFYRGYNNELAHRIEAGADMFLMPSRYEPCGLNQMYSLRYGTAPVVRRTGGLADTVVPFDPKTGEGTGFSFDAFTANALRDTIVWALQVWTDQKAWARMQQNGMAQDFSWARQGAAYVDLYRKLTGTE